MPVRCTEHQDAFVWVVYLVREKAEQGKALFVNVERRVGIFLQNCHRFFPIHFDDKYFRTEGVENRVGDDGVRAILQYRPSDLYLTDMKETMAIFQKDTHTHLHVCK